jgi:mannose-6-phosphate isomerase-like protein (cupin superfamily)
LLSSSASSRPEVGRWPDRLHVHSYEEAICILDGSGIIHIDDWREPIRAGSSVFLPPGTPHCLENASPRTLRLLGVFSPPGSPAGKEDAEPNP